MFTAGKPMVFLRPISVALVSLLAVPMAGWLSMGYRAYITLVVYWICSIILWRRIDIQEDFAYVYKYFGLSKARFIRGEFGVSPVTSQMKVGQAFEIHDEKASMIVYEMSIHGFFVVHSTLTVLSHLESAKR